MSFSLAVDIGGTFTDVVLRQDDGSLTVEKTLTTHDDLLEGFFRGVSSVLTKRGIESDAVDGLVVHATTIVTNALIERKGSPTALVVTDGFRDVLTIRNEHRYDMFDLQIEFAPPLVAREMTFGIVERTLADGVIETLPTETAMTALADEIAASGAKSVAICLLNSFANPENERAIARAITARLPDVFLCISSDVSPQIREYLRTSTTAINAYAMPISQPYLRRMTERLAEEGFAAAPLIMLSSGGIVGAETAGRTPVRMIESGPAAGALAACHYAGRMGIDRLMSFDMGGTTAKACLIEHGQPLITGLFEVDRRYRFKEGSGMPVTVPSIDMIEIGAGGGSIASVDGLGLLKVGPASAGSMPGPACYGRGGIEATVTDADLVLGLIDADSFLGGDMALDRKAAEAAVTHLAEVLGITPIHAARGIYRVVIQAMAAAARTHATDRGVDYRGMPLFAFGGAGALHACGVAELLESTSVIIPPQSSVLSAFGTLVTPVRLDLARSSVTTLSTIDWSRVDALLSDMVTEGVDALTAASCAPQDILLMFGAEMRYFGQQNEVSIAFDGDPRALRDVAAIEAMFAAAYFDLYGVNPSHVPVEVVTWKVTTMGPVVGTVAPPAAQRAQGVALGRRRVEAWSDGGEAIVFERDAIGVGQAIVGPAILVERETTVAVPPGWTARADTMNCIIITKD